MIGQPKNIENSVNLKINSKKSFWQRLNEQRQLVMLTVPFLIVIIIFNYAPLWGWIIAFQDYKPHLGMWNSEWVGLKNFQDLFGGASFYLALRNTLAISFLKLILNFVGSITLAIMLNEVYNVAFKRLVQTISYLPHFVSWVVAANIVAMALSGDGGIVNEVLIFFGIIKEPISFLGEGKYFWMIAALSELWKEIGWNAIIYIAAMMSIDPQLYEAASIDGAGRIRRIFSVTIPGIAPTIKILLILSVGWLLRAGFEQIYLLQKPVTWEYSEILDTYILKYGMKMGRWSFAAAAGIFNSIAGMILVVTANKISKRIDGEKIF